MIAESGKTLPNRTRRRENVKTSWHHFGAGAIGGMVAAIVTSPLEVVKIRLQTQESRSFLMKSNPISELTTWRVLQTIAQTEGISGLWRGIAVNLVGVIPARAVYFGTYSKLKTRLASDEIYPTVTNFVAASLSGCISASVTCPIWVIKTRYQLLPVHSTELQLTASGNALATTVNHSSTGTAREIKALANNMIKEEGLSSLFKGLSASYWGVLEGAMQLAMYEELKYIYRHYSDGENPSKTQLFAMAAVSKLTAAVMTYPHEVVRTRLRDQRTPKIPGTEKYKGMIQAIRRIFAEEGIASIYGGMPAHLMKTVPNAAIMYLIVELISGT